MDQDKFVTSKIMVPIDAIHPNPWNPNYETPAQFKFLKESIQTDGFIGSIFVRKYGAGYQILNGEHRWKAAKELGYTELPADNIGEISDELAMVFTIKMNKGGQDDQFKLGKILKEMNQEFQQKLPFTVDEIEHTKSLVTFDFAQYDKQSELPERTPGMLVVLPFNNEESGVWLKAKEELVKRGIIGTDNSKKKQDIQAVMWLIKNALGVLIGSDGSDRVTYEVDTKPVDNSVV